MDYAIVSEKGILTILGHNYATKWVYLKCINYNVFACAKHNAVVVKLAIPGLLISRFLESQDQDRQQKWYWVH